MKKSFLFVTLVLMGVFALSQTPQAFKYQMVARNNAGEILASQNISFRMTILQGALPGTVVYVEIHAATTNASGLVTLEIGRGTPVSGNFAAINWSTTPVFLKTEIDPVGGSAFVEMGTSELLSVPYAFESNHAKKASTLNLFDENGNEYDITVDTLGNLLVLPILHEGQCGNSFTDARDGKVYTTKKIGTQCWMAQNLNIGTRINGTVNPANNTTIEKYCYGNSDAQCDLYGGLYQWNEMMNYTTTPGLQGICPDGWHLPTDAEWCTLTTYLDATVNCSTTGWSGTNAGGKMKEAETAHWSSPNTGATNSSGFTALPGGYRYADVFFSDLSDLGFWWSSSQLNASNAWNRHLRFNYNNVGRSDNNMSYGFSVRCIWDN